MLWVLVITIVIMGFAVAVKRRGSTDVETPRTVAPHSWETRQPISPAPAAAHQLETDEQLDCHDDGSAEFDPTPATASRQTADFTRPGRGRIWREDYVTAEMEREYCVRDQHGLPALRLVNGGDRLAVWSAADGGVLINPKGSGLRKIGLYSSYARGSQYASATASRGAPRRPGIMVELRRYPSNQHDPNAVGMIGKGGRFAWVQRGRAPAVARRMDAGEDLAAVCLREGFFLIGARTDLEHMLA